MANLVIPQVGHHVLAVHYDNGHLYTGKLVGVEDNGNGDSYYLLADTKKDRKPHRPFNKLRSDRSLKVYACGTFVAPPDDDEVEV